MHPGDRLKPTKQQQRLWLDGLNFGQKQRLRFLEARLLWDGEFNRKDVCDQFGVTPNHFTRELSAYKLHFPENLKYDETSRIYRPTEHFKPAFATGDVEEYFALLRAYSQHPSDSIMVELGSKVSCGSLPFPDTHIDRDILRGILLAIRRKIGGEISYQSFSQALPKIRTIWPHALLWTGDQWHIRAFDDHRQMHINLAITRITTLKYTAKPRPKEALVDAEWESEEMIEVVPNPYLSLDQQHVVARVRHDPSGGWMGMGCQPSALPSAIFSIPISFG